eukprot:4054803-Pyramimonas_sp.AAC.1
MLLRVPRGRGDEGGGAARRTAACMRGRKADAGERGVFLVSPEPRARPVPCGHSRWGLRWSSLWSHEPCEGCAKMG